VFGFRVGLRVGLDPEPEEEEDDDTTETHFPLNPHRSEQHEASNLPSLVQTWPFALQLDTLTATSSFDDDGRFVGFLVGPVALRMHVLFAPHIKPSQQYPPPTSQL
jgi:hypothetical protein